MLYEDKVVVSVGLKAKEREKKKEGGM